MIRISRNRPLRAILVAVVTGLLSTTIAQADLIGAPGGNEVRTWGVGNTPFYGQTITAPGETLLDQFSFWLGRTSPLSSTPTPSIDFYAYVYAWNSATNTVSGSALFTSTLMNHSATSESPFTRFDFATGGLSLVEGEMYALILGVSGGSGGVFWESNDVNAYTGGDFIYNNFAPNTVWAVGFPTATDLRFEAQFSSVPEPGTLALLGIGFVALGLSRRRRTI